MNQQIKIAKSERKDTDERKQKLEVLAQLTQKEQELQKRIDEINKNHPDRYKEFINDGKQLLVLSDLVNEFIYFVYLINLIDLNLY